MPSFDDLLTRELQRAARPAAPDPQRVVAEVRRRRARRGVVRRVQSAALAVAVLAATATGYTLPSDIFGDGRAERSGSRVDDLPSTVPEPSPRGPGLGFPVCSVSSIEGDFDGDGTTDTAFVATRLAEIGGCPQPEEAFNVIAIDLDADGLADVSYGPIECQYECRTFSAPDLDDDGRAELLVLQQGGSVVGLRPYVIRRAGGTDLEITPIVIGEPGDPKAGYRTGDHPILWLGGDGFSLDTLRCVSELGDRRLLATRARQEPPDRVDSVWRAHETTFRFRNVELIVVDARDLEEPYHAVDPPSFASGEELCGSRLGP